MTSKDTKFIFHFFSFNFFLPSFKLTFPYLLDENKSVIPRKIIATGTQQVHNGRSFIFCISDCIVHLFIFLLWTVHSRIHRLLLNPYLSVNHLSIAVEGWGWHISLLFCDVVVSDRSIVRFIDVQHPRASNACFRWSFSRFNATTTSPFVVNSP